MRDLIGESYTNDITKQIFNEYNKQKDEESDTNHVESDLSGDRNEGDQQQSHPDNSLEGKQETQDQNSKVTDETQTPPKVQSNKRNIDETSLDSLIFANKQNNNNFRNNKRKFNNNNNNNEKQHRLDPQTYKLSKDLTKNFLESNKAMKAQYDSYNYKVKQAFEQQLLQQHFMAMNTANFVKQQFEMFQEQAKQKAAEEMQQQQQKFSSTRGRGSVFRGGISRGSPRGRGGASFRGKSANKSMTFGNQSLPKPAALDKPLTDDMPKHKTWVRSDLVEGNNNNNTNSNVGVSQEPLPKSKKFTNDDSQQSQQSHEF